MARDLDDIVRAWTESGPADLRASSLAELWATARASFSRFAGPEVARPVSVEDIEGALDRAGVRPRRCVGVGGAYWVLSLSEPVPVVA